MGEDGGFFAVIGHRHDLFRTRQTNIGPYLVSFRVMAGEVSHWGNRVINFGLSPDAASSATRVHEQIPLPRTAGRMTFMGLTDLTMISRHSGRLRVRYRSLSCESPDEIHEFGVTGPRRLVTTSDIRALEFELGRYTGYNGITIIDISVVEQ